MSGARDILDPEAGPVEAPVIERRSLTGRDEDPVDFHALRREAIDRAQAASGRIWTDYNLHDPGVTILEQVCYALTELAYRADFPVADHLCGPGGEIDYDRQALFRPQDVLPSRATTQSDYRRLLIDRTEELADARFAAPYTRAPGLHRLRLRPTFNRLTADVHATQKIATAKTVYRANRGLGEDIDEGITLIEPRLCDLRLDASIEGLRDPDDVAAEIFRRAAVFVSGLPRPRSYDELIRAGIPFEDIFDGPATYTGVIRRGDLPSASRGRLVLSDLRQELLTIDGVRDISRLELQLDDGQIIRRVLEWPADEWAPRLRTPDVNPDLGQFRLKRRGAVVTLDARAVARRLGDTARPLLAGAGAAGGAFEHSAPPPLGIYRPPQPYESVQNHFPTIYGLESMRARDPGPAADPRVDQLRAYLTLFDQVLANGLAQLNHVDELFRPQKDDAPSYWRGPLGEAQIEGVGRLWARSPAEVDAEVYADFDPAVERRDRVLDYLLALYGEVFPQNTSRQFMDYLDTRELGQALTRNKTTYLTQAVILGRDRAAGFDYALDLWANPIATTGLHRRICLLLGFGRWRARPLADLPGPRGAKGFAASRHVVSSGQAAPRKGRPLGWPDGLMPAGRAEIAAMRRVRNAPELHGGLMTHGVYRRRYYWCADNRGDGGHLMVGRDRGVGIDPKRPTREGWWDLGHFDSEASAGRFAHLLRRRLLRLNTAFEGMHTVEHILLRPRAAGVEAIDPDFHPLRTTFVFPNWTVRTTRAPFQNFADETVQINCPAHVTARCLWLDLAGMQQFERRYALWLKALQRWSTRGQGVEQLDRASAALSEFIAQRLAAQDAEAD